MLYLNIILNNIKAEAYWSIICEFDCREMFNVRDMHTESRSLLALSGKLSWMLCYKRVVNSRHEILFYVN